MKGALAARAAQSCYANEVVQFADDSPSAGEVATAREGGFRTLGPPLEETNAEGIFKRPNATANYRWTDLSDSAVF